MSDVVLIDRLGDITFGLPEDLAPHRKPWAYYEILGVERGASTSEIKKAVRRLSVDNHPDRYATKGAEIQQKAGERQQLINTIGDILADDGGKLGEEWSRRRLYDRISGYGEFFGATHIEYKSKRTVTVAENLLDLLELEKKHVEAEYEFKTDNPEIVELVEQVTSALKEGQNSEAERVHRCVVEKLAAKKGMSVAEFEQKQNEEIEERKNRARERKQQAVKGLEALFEDRTALTHTLFDIWYTGEKNSSSVVTFNTSGRCILPVPGFKNLGDVVKLGLYGSPVLVGLRKVHFKAEYANVLLKDAYLEGIFQLVHGEVKAEYEGSSYGSVIRVKAPKVNVNGEFERKGDLYIPQRFAVAGWETKKPAVDIAVFDGSVELVLKRAEMQERYYTIPYNGGGGGYNKGSIDDITYSTRNQFKKMF